MPRKALKRIAQTRALSTLHVRNARPLNVSVPGGFVAGNGGTHFVRALSRRLAPEQGTAPAGSAVVTSVRRPLRR